MCNQYGFFKFLSPLLRITCVTRCAFADTSAIKCLYPRHTVEDHIRTVETDGSHLMIGKSVIESCVAVILIQCCADFIWPWNHPLNSFHSLLTFCPCLFSQFSWINNIKPVSFQTLIEADLHTVMFSHLTTFPHLLVIIVLIGSLQYCKVYFVLHNYSHWQTFFFSSLSVVRMISAFIYVEPTFLICTTFVFVNMIMSVVLLKLFTT